MGKELINNSDDFKKSIEYLKDKAGVYILKFKDDSPYIGQSTNLYNRLLTHKSHYGDFDFEILKQLSYDTIKFSKYIISTILIYLEGRYIDTYGLKNLQNKVNTYKQCCDISDKVTIYNFDGCTKEITYNLFEELKLCCNDIDIFWDKCKFYKLRDIERLPYYKDTLIVENFKNSICNTFKINKNDCNKNYKQIKDVLLQYFKKKGYYEEN